MEHNFFSRHFLEQKPTSWKLILYICFSLVLKSHFLYENVFYYTCVVRYELMCISWNIVNKVWLEFQNNVYCFKISSIMSISSELYVTYWLYNMDFVLHWQRSHADYYNGTNIVHLMTL